MAMSATARVSAEFKRPNGAIITLHEGDIVHGLTYKSGNEVLSIDGAIRVINATTKACSSYTNTCPPMPYLHKYVSITSLVIDSSCTFTADLTKISVSNIVDIESVDADSGVISVGSGAQFRPLDEVIAEAPAGAVIRLQAGTYETPLTLDKSVTIWSDSGAVLSGPITFTPTAPSVPMALANAEADLPKPGVHLHLEGVTLTGDALVTVNTIEGAVTGFTMRNCTFGGHNLTEKTMPISIKGENDTYLAIEGCVFEEENKFSYNLIDVYGKLITGSSISFNTFKAGCCAHNQISLYNAADHARISISNNIAEYSGNMVRIGFKGNPQDVKVSLYYNEYAATDESDNGIYAGLALVQPYSTQTESFAGVTLTINGTKHADKHAVCYLYAGKKDTPFTADNKPIITVDGAPLDPIPDASPVA